MLTYEFFQHIAQRSNRRESSADRMSIIVLRTKDVRLHSATPVAIGAQVQAQRKEK